MVKTLFPRTKIANLSVSRMIMGTNNIVGGSHRTRARDLHIKEINNNAKAVADIIETYLEYGVDTLIGGFYRTQYMLDGIKQAQENSGQKVNTVGFVVFDTSDTKDGMKDAKDKIKLCAKAGYDVCMPLHNTLEELVNKGKRKINRIENYLDMIRQENMIPGLSAHMPEIIEYSDENEYDVETYIQIFNSMGFMMQKEVELVHNVIWEAQKPVIAIKTMAAGKLNPFVGLTFAWNAIRDKDMIAVGCMTPEEVRETIEYSMAAIEHRRPMVGTRMFQYDVYGK